MPFQFHSSTVPQFHSSFRLTIHDSRYLQDRLSCCFAAPYEYEDPKFDTPWRVATLNGDGTGAINCCPYEKNDLLEGLIHQARK